jgi:hypothetical protein
MAHLAFGLSIKQKASTDIYCVGQLACDVRAAGGVGNLKKRTTSRTCGRREARSLLHHLWRYESSPWAFRTPTKARKPAWSSALPSASRGVNPIRLRARARPRLSQQNRRVKSCVLMSQQRDAKRPRADAPTTQADLPAPVVRSCSSRVPSCRAGWGRSTPTRASWRLCC